MDCVFCKIIKGEIPCYKIFEDEKTLAFLDISKDAVGHTLVVPKKHVESLVEISEEVLNQTMKIAQKISKHYIENCGFDGVQIINNCGSSAGQSVMHFHIHVIPRKKDDGLNGWSYNKSFEMDLEKIAKKLKLKK